MLFNKISFCKINGNNKNIFLKKLSLMRLLIKGKENIDSFNMQSTNIYQKRKERHSTFLFNFL